MPIRFYVPLPGPYAWVPGGKRRERQAPTSVGGRLESVGRALLVVALLWAPVMLAVIWAVIGGYYIHPVVGVLVNVVEVVLVVLLVQYLRRRAERRRLVSELEEDVAAEAELQAEIDAEEAERARRTVAYPHPPPRRPTPPGCPPPPRYDPRGRRP